MQWYWYAILAIGLLVAHKVYRVATRTPEEERLLRWERMANHDRHAIPRDQNPMRFAMARRRVIEELVATGHGKAAASVMKEVDAIITSLEAKQNALLSMGFGEWFGDHEFEGSLLWRGNGNPRFKALYEDAQHIINVQLDGIIDHVRGIANEGVKSSAEQAKLALTMAKQDYEFESSAMASTTKEMTERPLEGTLP